MVIDRELFSDSLPTCLTRFVGREQELDVLVALSAARLVTICGVGGAGKTRLAIELAKRLRTRESGEISEITYWVPLAAVTDPSDVPAAVAEGIGLRVAPSPGATVAVVNALQGHRSRLVLDNCEHLAVACRDVLKDLLPGCPGLSVVATSRIPLGLDDEQVYAAPPMGDEAKDLFVDRGISVAPTYALTEMNTDPIAAICRRLDGLPLAVELAAGWVRVLAPRDLLSRLEHLLDHPPVSDVVEERHRSM